jgi:hypothetical protein
VVQERDQTWNNNAWENYNLLSYTYDNSDNLSQYVYEYWNQTWENDSRYTYTYDISNNCTSILSEGWKNSNWTNSYESIYTFDDNGNCIQGENFIWNGIWVFKANDIVLYYNHNQNQLNYNAAIATVSYVQVTGVADENISVNQFSLKQNYPNPFNPTTTINYSISNPGNVKLTVYNAIGSKIATIVNENKPAGSYSVKFDGANLASGIYLYRLESGSYSTSRKFILMK